jgi:hypothetical protein
MTNQKDADPLVGDELVEISLHPYHLYLTFLESELQLGAPFMISVKGAPSTEFDPKEGTGDLRILWSLIGKRVKAVIWEEAVSIVLADDEVISIGPSQGRPRGVIKGRRDMTIEDF